MKVSGFTIARNAILYGYPIAESLRSLLPLVDELVVAVGDSDDNTWELVSGIGDRKIKAFRTVWDMTKREGGAVLAEQTNIALAECTGEWAVYLQSDEILDDAEIPIVRRRLEDHLKQATEGLSFSYVHFYGSYATVQDNWCIWYRREVRAVRTGKGIVSVGDAAGFKIKDGGRLRRLIRADAGAHVYHYGWVRPPGVMVEKRRHAQRLYYDDAKMADIPVADRVDPQQPFYHLGHLRLFHGSHPSVMQHLVAEQEWTFESGIETQPPRWLRYVRIAISCPRDTARIVVSRALVTWNSHIRRPKLR